MTSHTSGALLVERDVINRDHSPILGIPRASNPLELHAEVVGGCQGNVGVLPLAVAKHRVADESGR